MSPFFLTIILPILFNGSVTNGMKWKNYDAPTDANLDKALLETMFVRLTVKLHMWADPASSRLRPPRSDAPQLAILFSVTKELWSAYAIAEVLRASEHKIIGVTHFHQAVAGNVSGETAMKQAQTDYKKNRSFWLPHDSTSVDGLVAVMCYNYGIRIVLQRLCDGSKELNVKVSALYTTAENTYSFEVENSPTAAGQPIADTIVNYVDRWNKSLLLMDRSVSDYFIDPRRMLKDATVRDLLDEYMEQYAAENQDGGAKGGDGLVRGDFKLKVRKVWRVAQDHYNRETPVVAICAAVCGTGPGGSNNGLLYTVVEIRIHFTGTSKVYTNELTNEAGAIKKAAQLLSLQDDIAKEGKPYVLMKATTTDQIKVVAQRLQIL